ncbi:hypothetical protein DCAR_0418244 [Daucus carota subsp. sativus]|uniref:Uncharacterized protein n=1 Tax=Daucus carota subsp. sativus TaxID=79200 RepID=A0AAF0X274_DAUCS|nr:hypothetical protein DCAR_0418244 [Daucus carota subsp. sativus]
MRWFSLSVYVVRRFIISLYCRVIL